MHYHRFFLNVLTTISLISIPPIHAFALSAADDTQVPPPNHGSILVNGLTGAGQSNNFFLSTCEPDIQFELKKQSCQDITGTYTLNTPAYLPAGLYFALYNHSGAVIKVSAGQQAVVKLATITIPPGDEPTQFRVFEDLTDTKKNRISQEKKRERMDEFRTWCRSTVNLPASAAHF